MNDSPAKVGPASGASSPRRILGIRHGVVITVGIVIGAGIFRAPASVAQLTSSPAEMIFTWILGGVLSLVCALTYAELSTMSPSTGGDYHFLTRAYGRHVAFFFGWARATVIVTGSIALLGFTLGDYLSTLVPLGRRSSALYAAAAVIVLTAINLLNLRRSVQMQSWVTAVEAGGVLLVALAGLLLVAPPAAVGVTESAAATTASFGLAMVFVLLAYGGWSEAAYLSAELVQGARRMVAVLVISCLAVTVLYVLFVIGALRALGFDGLRSSTAVATDVMRAAVGPSGAKLIAALVAVAVFSSMNATMIVGARSNHALGGDWHAFAFLNGWNVQRSVPVAALLAQAGVALVLIAFGATEKSGFDSMVEFTAPVFWFFLMLSSLALLLLRRREPGAPRPFRVPLYPLLPLLAVGTTAYLFYSSVAYAQSQRAVHVALYVMCAGAIAWVYAIARERWRRETA